MYLFILSHCLLLDILKPKLTMRRTSRTMDFIIQNVLAALAKITKRALKDHPTLVFHSQKPIQRQHPNTMTPKN